MTIEITNQGLLGQTPTPGEEAKSGLAQKNNTTAEVSTGRPVDSVQITENAQALNSLQQTISTLPVVDTKRVEAAIAKVQTRSFDILGDTDARLSSAERIADKILAMDEQLPETNNTDKA